MVTPVDFHTPEDLLSKWARKIDVPAWVGEGNVSGEALNLLYLSLMPFRLTQQKYVHLLAGGLHSARIENFLRVEQWIFDSPDQAGAAFREFVVWFYQENRLVHNTLEIAGRKVDLRALRMPILNLTASAITWCRPKPRRPCGSWSAVRTTRRSNWISGTSACTSANGRNARCRAGSPGWLAAR